MPESTESHGSARPLPRSTGEASQTTVSASDLQIGQSLLMNGRWRMVLDIETPDDKLDDLKLVLNPNLPGTRFLKLSPTRPVQMRGGNE